MAVSPGRQKAASPPTLPAWPLICAATLTSSRCASLPSRINAPVGGGHYCRSGRRCLEKEPFSCTIAPTLPTDLLFLSTFHPRPDLAMARGGGRSTPGRENRRRRITYPWFLESSEGGGEDGSCSSRTPQRSSRTPPSSSRGRGSYAVCRAIDPDPISFIDLESDEEEQVVDPGLA